MITMKTRKSSVARVGILAGLGGILILYFFCVNKRKYPVEHLEPDQWLSSDPTFTLRKILWLENIHLPVTVVNNKTILELFGDDSDDNSTDGDADCSDVHNVNKSQRCDFTKSTDDCAIDEGFIDYTTFVYCQFDSSLIAFALIILFVWWLFLFIGLAVTADDYFCPSLTVISKSLRLSHNIAGVTLLAFGNGAPDIFSAIAAIGNAKNGEAGLAFGALLGAGVFVTAVVAGTISIICPFDCMQRPFLRDVIFYVGAVFWTFYVMWDKKITKVEAIGFILMYILYVLVVIFGRYIYQKLKTKPPTVLGEVTVENKAEEDSRGQEDLNSSWKDQDTEKEPLLKTSLNTRPVNDLASSLGDSTSTDGNQQSTAVQQFLSAINPIDTENWADMGIIKRIYEVFKSPLVFLLIITTPVVDLDEDLHKWNRYLNSLQLTTGLLFASAATKLGFNTLGSSFPVWALVLIIGVILSALVFFTSKDDEPPRYHTFFAYFGFVVSVVWIYSVANEVVNILQTFGVVFSISNAVLGLTLLAWGNSIGDLIADTVMARQGFPRIGISACFGGPLFNLLLGVGLPFTIATVKDGKDYDLSITFEEYVLAGFLALSLLTSLIVVPLSKFRMSRPYGILLIIVYIVFLVVALLTESGVIDVDIN